MLILQFYNVFLTVCGVFRYAESTKTEISQG